ncbi:FAD-dependent oxidoreductase [Modestobacter sp. VKM Ac-2979]|uniref:FAD-dependent oxidoreductase n=1 Tax=unclassified Modestobacter TaxID=2643866 RepID=UPI0022ABB252|nr:MULTISPECIES: FAD-dependent oxidoreductase [unclassified Modestobacter]MCZ2812795.1 FAD-dependent oxidoreductase [Modestobacter sp. VKM Ac-2979]MCZ2843176.1 FAD-dependent oxidoreductase [Modestobacter sp. VKM Ac-2980]
MSRRLVVIGGSDAGISAGLRAREVDPTAEVTVVVADAYPNFSICGIPYHVSGDVPAWQSLAHRTYAELEDAGLTLRVETRATGIDVVGQRVAVTTADGATDTLAYDGLVVGTGAHPAVPAMTGVGGPDGLSAADGVHLLHTIDDTHALMAGLEARTVRNALIVGAGYIGVEMSEALVARGIATTVAQRPSEVLATVDAELGALVRAEMEGHGVEVLTGTSVTGLARTDDARIAVSTAGGRLERAFDLVVLVAGVRPDVQLLVDAGASTGAGGAVVVDETMATGLPHVWAAGDCVVTHHRLLDVTYLPLGTTAHKQGRVAGANAVGGHARFAGSVGTQVVKVFDLVVARTGLLEHEARAAGFRPVTTQATPDDHKAYYPGARPITIRVTADADTGRLLGAQLVGRLGSEVARRADVVATALFHGMAVEDLADLDLAYTPPLGSPWDAVQLAGQAWTREHRPPARAARSAALA